jgi:pimeloyl-ACP methyl ester carboxylesterase
MPLLLTHGWPGSFCEYLDLLPLLTDPPDEGSRARAPGRAVFWILAGRYRLCLTTSC